MRTPTCTHSRTNAPPVWRICERTLTLTFARTHEHTLPRKELQIAPTAHQTDFAPCPGQECGVVVRNEPCEALRLPARDQRHLRSGLGDWGSAVTHPHPPSPWLRHKKAPDVRNEIFAKAPTSPFLEFCPNMKIMVNECPMSSKHKKTGEARHLPSHNDPPPSPPPKKPEDKK